MPFEVMDATPVVRFRAWLVEGCLVTRKSEILDVVNLDRLIAGKAQIFEGEFVGDYTESEDWQMLGWYGTLWDAEGYGHIIRAGYYVPPGEIESADMEIV